MNKIREIRKECGLTQDELAAMVNTSQQQIQRWETDQHDITLDMACKISGALKCDLKDIFPVEMKQAYTRS
jgi:DNA-binding XRE family transcriptional regulator